MKLDLNLSIQSLLMYYFSVYSVKHYFLLQASIFLKC